MSGQPDPVKASELPVDDNIDRDDFLLGLGDIGLSTYRVWRLLKLAVASDVRVPGMEIDGSEATVKTALQAIFSADFIFNDRVDPKPADETAGAITCDLQDGGRLAFSRTLVGDETLEAPSNAPLGATFYLFIDPGAHTLSFAAGYEGPNNQLPNIEGETLLVIWVVGVSRFLVHVAGSDYGDGS